ATVPAPGEVTHACPVGDSAATPCCERTPFELPGTDRMTLDPRLVTCGNLRTVTPPDGVKPDPMGPILSAWQLAYVLSEQLDGASPLHMKRKWVPMARRLWERIGPASKSTVTPSQVEAAGKGVHELLCSENAANGECTHDVSPWEDVMARTVIAALGL